MNRYWRYQTGGWLALLVLDFAGKYTAKMMIPSLLVAVIVLYTLGLIASHGMRHVYKTYCASLSIPKILPIAFMTSLIGSLLSSSGLMLGLYLSNSKVFTAPSIDPLQIFNYNLFLMWLFLAIWTGLYFFITRQRQVDALNLKQQALKDNLEQSQLHALMNQLNPHFMFNCINNIRALILEDKHKARDMLAHMADMLRYNLQDQSQATETIERELEIAQAFMQLASIQFENRLLFNIELDEKVPRSSPIPRMLIQLLLENAVKHGIAKRREGGEVKLSIKLESQTLCIKVSNHGNLQPLQQPKTSGIGLENIRSRLFMLYQNSASFKIEQSGELVLATCFIPMEK